MLSPHDALLGCGGGFDRRGLIFEKVFGQAGLSPTVGQFTQMYSFSAICRVFNATKIILVHAFLQRL